MSPRTLALSALLLGLIAIPALHAQTVILVRHAERAGGTAPDIGLSDAGVCRAGRLAKMLGRTGVTQIYTSEVARTQQTAAPLGKDLAIKPEVIPAKDVDALVATLRKLGPHGVALVVGHSNTLPEIIRQLGAGSVAPIGDNDYDRMLIVTLTGPDHASAVMLQYPGCTP